MNAPMNFSQALALRAWYKATPESQELLSELDKDLKKWDAHVSESESSEAVVCCAIDARFDSATYRFILRVHEPTVLNPIDTANLPVQHRGVLKTHQRTRNVLKNFLPIVFDRLSADRQFALVMMTHPEHELGSRCIWATNTAGLGVSVVSLVQHEPRPTPKPIVTMEKVLGVKPSLVNRYVPRQMAHA